MALPAPSTPLPLPLQANAGHDAAKPIPHWLKISDAALTEKLSCSA